MKINKLDNNNNQQKRAFFNFISKLDNHGYTSFPEDYNVFKKLIDNTKPEIFLIYEKESIINYFYIVDENLINRTIIQTYNTNHLSNLEEIKKNLDFSNSIEVGVRDSENNKPESKLKFNLSNTYNFMELKKENLVDVKNNFNKNNYDKKLFDIKTDIENLTNIQNECFENHHGYQKNNTDEIKKELDLLISDNKSYYILGITDKNQKWVGYSWSNYNLNSKTAKLSMCGSVKSHRNNGVGTEAIRSSINHLFKIGCEKIQLEVDHNNNSAKKIYLEMGFEIYDNLRWYEII